MSESSERENMEVDVLFIGAGPATLASAIHLMSEVESFNESTTCSPAP
jgi:ribulose 1,5-bisphosphate synthetase/thiazole synthase